MLDIYDEKNWKDFLESHYELKELVIKAGLENNPKRVQELDGAFAWNFAKDVASSKAEEELALHLFAHDYRHPNSLNDALKARMQVAKEAGIDDL